MVAFCIPHFSHLADYDDDYIDDDDEYGSPTSASPTTGRKSNSD